MAIVRYIRKKKMRASFFTNGIKATRSMLEELCEAGVEDIAFHVDLTQEIKGYKTEMDLCEIRQEYIERARGLPLSVFFNNTITPANFHEVPDLGDGQRVALPHPQSRVDGEGVHHGQVGIW